MPDFLLFVFTYGIAVCFVLSFFIGSRVPCPSCDKKIFADSKKCPHCGEVCVD